MEFGWLAEYLPLLVEGFWRTIALMGIAGVLGLALAIPVALAQAAGGRVLGGLSRGFTTTIRGTPLLVQIYLLYYGIGDLLAGVPEVRQSFLWPYLREGF